MAKLKTSRLRHRSETSRFLFALLVVIPLSLLALAYIVISVGLILIPIFLVILIARNVVHAQFLGNSLRVDEHNFPHLKILADEVCETIDYRKPIEIFIYEDGSFNAMLVPWLKRRAVVLNSELVKAATDQELKWIIGRFVGYLKGKKSRLMIFEIFLNAFERLILFNMFLYPYERAAVLTGDRIGAHAIGNDPHAVFSAMNKLLVGPDLAEHIQYAGIERQNEELKSKAFFSVLARLYSPFPHMSRRYAEMQKYFEAVAPVTNLSERTDAPTNTASPANIFMSAQPTHSQDETDLPDVIPQKADPELFADTTTGQPHEVAGTDNPWPSPPVAAAERAALRPTIYETAVDEDTDPPPMADETPIMIEAGKSELLPENLIARDRKIKPIRKTGAGPGVMRLFISLLVGAAFYMATDFFLFGSELTLPGTLTYSHDMMLQLPVMTAVLWGLGFSACLITRLISGRRIAPWILLVLLTGWTSAAIFYEVNSGMFYMDDILPLMITGSAMFASAAFLTTLLPKSRELVTA